VHQVGGEAGEQLDLVLKQHGRCRSWYRASSRAGRTPTELGQGGPCPLGGVAGPKLHPAHDEHGAVWQAGGFQVERAQEGLGAHPKANVPPGSTVTGAHPQLADLNGHP
jgi:hypothetical protein